jgi:hypothetical protein
MRGMGCTLHIRCALSIHQQECRKVWGARYTLVHVIYWKIWYLFLSPNEEQSLTPCIEECNYSACPFQINKASAYNS